VRSGDGDLPQNEAPSGKLSVAFPQDCVMLAWGRQNAPAGVRIDADENPATTVLGFPGAKTGRFFATLIYRRTGNLRAEQLPVYCGKHFRARGAANRRAHESESKARGEKDGFRSRGRPLCRTCVGGRLVRLGYLRSHRRYRYCTKFGSYDTFN